MSCNIQILRHKYLYQNLHFTVFYISCINRAQKSVRLLFGFNLKKLLYNIQIVKYIRSRQIL